MSFTVMNLEIYYRTLHQSIVGATSCQDDLKYLFLQEPFVNISKDTMTEALRVLLGNKFKPNYNLLFSY